MAVDKWGRRVEPPASEQLAALIEAVQRLADVVAAPAPAPIAAAHHPPEPDPRLDEILAALRDIAAKETPAPVVHVDAPEVSVPAPVVTVAAQPAPIVNVPELRLDDETLSALRERPKSVRSQPGIREVTLRDTNSDVVDPASKQGLEAVRDRLPAILDADGGVKVHLQNASSAAGLTNAELRAAAVPMSLAALPAVTADSAAYIGYVSPAFARKVGEGRAWITGRKITSGLGGGIAFLLRNPSTSDRGAYIVGLRLVATAATTVRIVDSHIASVGVSEDALDIRLTNSGRTAIDETVAPSRNFQQASTLQPQKAFVYYTENGVVSNDDGGTFSAPTPGEYWSDEIYLPADRAQTLALPGPYVLGVNKAIAFEATLAAGASIYVTMYHYEG